jgi:hypothetical protein
MSMGTFTAGQVLTANRAGQTSEGNQECRNEIPGLLGLGGEALLV